MPFTYRMLFGYLKHTTESELDQEVMIGTDAGFVAARTIGVIKEEDQAEDLAHNQIVIDTSRQ